jgi:N-carbamoyl-L-amino-acid hydrolase
MMNFDFASLRINPTRLKADFDALAEIGSTGDGGVHRPALSPAHLAARAWFREQALASGLEIQVDGAGNQSARLPCSRPGSGTLLLGSHLDTVPAGGRFDGALGVLAALEVLRTTQEAGLSLPVNLEAIEFTDEEGTLIGLLGSSALAGKITQQDLETPRCGPEAFQKALEGVNRV